MKKSIIYLIIPVLSFLGACKDFIDIDQPDIVEQEQNFQDLQTVRSSVMGIYSIFAQNVESQFLAGEVRADLVNATNGASYYIREFNSSDFSPSNPYISPRPYYKIITNVNEILTQLDKTLNNAAVDSSEYYNLKGELLSMRAWANMQMIKMYGKCKYIKSPMDDIADSGGSYLERDSVLNLILGDLRQADTLYVGLNMAEWERVRISRFYINVLLGETYLEKGMFREAADKFFEVIRKGDDQFQVPGSNVAYYDKFKLSSLFADNNWQNIFNKNWMGVRAYEEYLFYIGFSSKYDQTNKLQDWTASVNGTYQVKPSDWITGQLNSVEDPYRGMGISIKTESDDNIIINKYNISRAAGIGDAGLIVNRAARIHLLLAECYNRLGETDSALMMINKGIDLGSGYRTLGVRGRVSLPAITPADTIVDEDLTVWVENLILDEMGRELAFEGNRWYDLVRIATRENDPSVLADRVAQKFPVDKQEAIREKFMDPENWYLPLFE